MTMLLNITINGQQRTFEIDAKQTLLELLRSQPEYQSVHRSCEEGECGACTVLLDGEPVNSCLILAASVEGATVLTSEGLVRQGQPHPLMQAFTAELGIQCGFCTPGMLMNSYALISGAGDIELTDQQIRKSLEGNLCRCTGYVNIVNAVKKAQQAKNGGQWW
ncbi:(2Fe-2S)-binding protein [Desulforhopalus singaporensis]|uniref:Carbon-monoxide dehydrogenase small subunit n=1 Tax=Desulforhopalus singaporensis TaxID=91360 RepID=A0A1H0RSE5_9BACT|nr:(2Fe-2S)-binding protein [Desulforhopalus singaporensis]SDP32335.1 carbon-monoxide dehydrogenase small subunit [Desulforhopalus singaporensis]